MNRRQFLTAGAAATAGALLTGHVFADTLPHANGSETLVARAQAALNHLMPYTQEFWSGSEAETAAAASGTGAALATLKPAWDALVDEALAEATLKAVAPYL